MLSWMFRRRPVNAGHLDFTMYTRAGCHLCDEALAVLQEAQERHGFKLQVQDVDAAPELVAQYGNCVPVVLINDKLRFRGRVNPVLLRRILEAEARHQA